MRTFILKEELAFQPKLFLAEGAACPLGPGYQSIIPSRQ